MASEVKKRTPSKTDSLGNEIAAIVFLAMAILVFLCLISYSPDDPSIITASSQKTQNWIGMVGANIAAFLISFVGWTAYFLPALLALVAWRFFRAEKLTFSFSRIIGYVLFIVSGASLLTLFGAYGGVTGAFFEQVFSRFLGRIGTGILLFAFLATAFVLITNLSLLSFLGDFGWAWENFRIRFDEWRGKRQELIEANNQGAQERAEKRRESRQEVQPEKTAKPEKIEKTEKPLEPEEMPTISVGDTVAAPIVAEEKKEIVTKKVTDIFNLSKNFKEKESGDLLEIDGEVSDFDRETEELPPKAFTSEEDILGISKPLDLIAESEKIPITPIQETGDLDSGVLEIEDEPKEIPSPKKTQTFENYALPTTEFLTPAAPRIEQKDEELLGIAQELTDKTKEFNVTGRVMHICQGPVVTTYEFKPDPGVKYSRVTGLADDLCLALKAESIRIDRIPGKAFVGIEVPNRERETIQLREVIESKKFQASDSLLSVALGKSIDGLNYVADLAKMPHLLIAGATGAGKSVGVNTLIVSILYKAKPDEVKLIMVDPKQVELNVYADIPHLATPIITDPKRASVALKWAVGQMERRYKDLAAWGVRNIDGYNSEVKRRNEVGQFTDEGEPHKKLPYLVIIIDELADLMMVAGKEVEESITRLAQMARAVGIHLVLATQRPSVDVITGLIKANFPSRISFRVSSKVDSRTIIDSNGAESLLGKGDMLFLPPGTSNLIRVHGAFVDEKEISKIVEHIKAQGNPEYDTTITKTDEELDDSDDLPGKRDPLFWEAIKTVVRNKSASTSLLQRHLRIGYGRAAAILDAMVREGYIGEMDGSKRARPILEAAYEVLEQMENGGEF